MTFLEFFETLIGCAQCYVTEALAKDPSSTPAAESIGGGIRSAALMAHMAGADQISLASEPTSGHSAVRSVIFKPSLKAQTHKHEFPTGPCKRSNLTQR